MHDSDDVEVDEVDRAQQEEPADPTERETEPVGGPDDDSDEADWIDQNTDAPHDDEGPEEKY
ncbi:hypothetical protein G7085_06175 [Tessaracoccus sp. HDW20]|uniref:hypothetical protein n=1 Tax=Tessaracoccus coleopterorum TaxID=2714950 RepID=UPI0018D36318|nr:hypothetical protein [Tessaracoccus coleopterorum]NHB84331.1 hypothetical protein [Tessaracoccus coleopterorum]